MRVMSAFNLEVKPGILTVITVKRILKLCGYYATITPIIVVITSLIIKT